MTRYHKSISGTNPTAGFDNQQHVSTTIRQKWHRYLCICMYWCYLSKSCCTQYNLVNQWHHVAC